MTKLLLATLVLFSFSALAGTPPKISIVCSNESASIVVTTGSFGVKKSVQILTEKDNYTTIDYNDVEIETVVIDDTEGEKVSLKTLIYKDGQSLPEPFDLQLDDDGFLSDTFTCKRTRTAPGGGRISRR